MKTIVLMRHGKASHQLYESVDYHRPLTEKGIKNSGEMARRLVAANLKIERFLSSPSLRTMQTAEIVKSQAKIACEIETDADFYLAQPEVTLSALAGSRDQQNCVLYVGHNPGLEDALATLTAVRTTMPTSAVAIIRCDINSWSELSDVLNNAKLIDFWTPDVLSN